MIEEILEVDRDVQVISLFTGCCARAALWTCPNCRHLGAGTAGYRWTTWSTRRTLISRSTTAGYTLSGRSRCGSVASMDNTKRKRATDAQVNHKRSGRLPEVTRNERFAGQGRQVEVAKSRTPDRR